MRLSALPALLLLPLALMGCDMLGIESTTAVAARREAEGKAIGGACRHAARSIEQCYEANRRADKAAVFAGWREMNDYMRESKLEAQPAAGLVAPAPSVAPASAEGGSPATSPTRRAGA
jgi:hypothetical protein